MGFLAHYQDSGTCTDAAIVDDENSGPQGPGFS